MNDSESRIVRWSLFISHIKCDLYFLLLCERKSTILNGKWYRTQIKKYLGIYKKLGIYKYHLWTFVKNWNTYTRIYWKSVQKSRHLKLNFLTSGTRVYSLFWLRSLHPQNLSKNVSIVITFITGIFIVIACWIGYFLVKPTGLYDYWWIQRSFKIAAMSYKSKCIGNNGKYMQSWPWLLTMDFFNNKFNGKLWISHVFVQ